MPVNPGSAALLFLEGSVLILIGICISARFLSTQRLQRDCVHATCYDSYDTLDDLILYRFLDRRLILSVGFLPPPRCYSKHILIRRPPLSALALWMINDVASGRCSSIPHRLPIQFTMRRRPFLCPVRNQMVLFTDLHQRDLTISVQSGSSAKESAGRFT